MKILYILTATQMAGFLRGHISSLRVRGFAPVLCVPECTESVEKLARAEGAQLVVCPMQRNISPWSDFVAYLGLVQVVWKERPAITVTLGPKAGLIGGLAAATCQVPCRIQTKWGIRLETTSGLLRLVLSLADKVASACAHRVLCDSASGRARTIELGLAPAEKVGVVGPGSANGIDTGKFSPTPGNLESARNFRKMIGAGDNIPLVGFVGRISRDKGLAEILQSWPLIRTRYPSALLALIGTAECDTRIEQSQLAELVDMPGVKSLGPRFGLEGIFPAFDVLFLPSHREGFGVVVLEAGALGVPTVGFEVTGMKDSVVSGATGQLVPMGDVPGLADAICRYLENKTLRNLHGEAARRRVISDFRQELIWDAYFEIFRKTAFDESLDVSCLR